MKKSELLKEVRPMVERCNGGGFICNCIDVFAYGKNNKTWAQAVALKRWITYVLLDGKYTLEDWLIKNVPEAEALADKKRPSKFYERTRITRLAWIDWMIKYWEARGD